MSEERAYCAYCREDEKAVFLSTYIRSEADRDKEAHVCFNAWRAGISPLEYEDWMEKHPDWPHNTAWAGQSIDLENGWKTWQGATRAHLCRSDYEEHRTYGWIPLYSAVQRGLCTQDADSL